VKEGAQTLLQLADLTLFVMKARPLDLDDKTRGLLTDETKSRLARLRSALTGAQDWTVPALEPVIRGFAEAEGVGIGKFGPALRGVLSGGSPAPDLASTLVALGRGEALARMADAVGTDA